MIRRLQPSAVASVSVPVLSNTIVSASATASRYFPPLTVILCAVRLADRREHRNRHRQLQGTGEIDHQHSQRFRRVSRQQVSQVPCPQGCTEQGGLPDSSALLSQAGLQLLRFLNHFYDLLIAAGATDRLHKDGDFTFFDSRTRIGGASFSLAYRNWILRSEMPD